MKYWFQKQESLSEGKIYSERTFFFTKKESFFELFQKIMTCYYETNRGADQGGKKLFQQTSGIKIIIKKTFIGPCYVTRTELDMRFNAEKNLKNTNLAHVEQVSSNETRAYQ